MRWIAYATLSFFVSLAAAATPELVVVGDSLSCGPFGAYLLQDLTANGRQVTLYCAVSSTPSHWLNGKNPGSQLCKTMNSSQPTLVNCGGDGKVPTLASILQAHPGAEFIIALGTNSLLQKTADSTYTQVVSALKADGHACIWIGPPHLNPAQSRGFPAGRVATMEKNEKTFYPSLVNQDCPLIDSRSATKSGTPGYQTVDGVHRGDAAGKYWLENIAPALHQKLGPTSLP